MPLTLYLWTGGAIFALGLAGTMWPGPVLRRLIALNLMGSGVFLVLVTTAAAQPTQTSELPRALVLAGMLVAFTLTAVAVRILWRRQQADSPAP